MNDDIELQEVECEEIVEEDKVVPEKLGMVDKILEKVISRKLIVFLTATGLLAFSDLDPDTWGLVAIVYVGGQSVIDAVKTYKYGDTM